MHQIFERLLVGRSNYNTISKHAQGFDRSVGILTILAAALLGFGVAAPIATINGFLGLEGQYSLAVAAFDLLRNGQGGYGVGLLVVFAVIPVLSIATAFDLWYKYELHSDRVEKLTKRVQICGQLWFLVMLACIGGLYYSNTLLEGTVLHGAMYYLLLSVLMQKIMLTRISRLLSTVKYEEED